MTIDQKEMYFIRIFSLHTCKCNKIIGKGVCVRVCMSAPFLSVMLNVLNKVIFPPFPPFVRLSFDLFIQHRLAGLYFI